MLAVVVIMTKLKYPHLTLNALYIPLERLPINIFFVAPIGVYNRPSVFLHIFVLFNLIHKHLFILE